MKKNHKRDVFIARLVFVLVCLIIIGAITALVMWGLDKRKASRPVETQTQTETETQTQQLIIDLEGRDEAIAQRETETETVQTETEEAEVQLKVTNNVKLRPDASTNKDPITGVPAGSVVKKLGEEGDWVQIEYNGQTGYIMSKYTEAVQQ